MFKMDNSYLSKKLLSQLNIIKTSRLTLIEAPSGFGKTTSVRTYLNKEEFNEFNELELAIKHIQSKGANLSRFNIFKGNKTL